jgi:hypothetical protein
MRREDRARKGTLAVIGNPIKIGGRIREKNEVLLLS